MGKRFVCGDIHGNYKGLKQCFERSNFNYEEDTLIQLGDIADGYSEMHLVMDELANIHPDRLILIKGNHDEWFKEWILHGIHPAGWMQGGEGSFKSYLKLIGKPDLYQLKTNGSGWLVGLNPDDVPPLHQKMLRDQHNYYIDDDNNLFIHAGFNRHFPIKGQDEYTFYWDRDLWGSALSFESMVRGKDGLHGNIVNKFKMKDGFKTVFIGHTSTVNWGITEPMKAANIWNLDTGGGFAGKVTIMNIDNTSEYYQSDMSTELYPDEKGRR